MAMTTISPRQQDILAFFEETFGDLYLFLLYNTLHPSSARDLAVDLYASFFRERRTLWWRSDVLTSEALLRTARKMVRNVSHWKMRTTDFSPMDAMFREASFDDPLRAKQVRAFHDNLLGLSHEDREIAVLGMLLGWPAEKLSVFFGREHIDVEQRLTRLQSSLLPSSSQGLQMLHGIQHFDLLRKDLRRVFLPEEFLEHVRHLLVERVEHGATVALNTVAMAFALLLLPLGLFGGTAMFLRPPLQTEMREIAALETLLAEEVRDYDLSMLKTEEALRGMGATLAMDDLRSLTAELAVLALREHAENKEEINTMIENLGWGSLEVEEIAGAQASFMVYMSHAHEEPPMR